MPFTNPCIVINYENNQQDALYRLIYYSKSALHISDDVFVHHQEHLTYLQCLVVFTQVAADWCLFVINNMR
jgi:hypothetical protein